jgi:hypothetical protein
VWAIKYDYSIMYNKIFENTLNIPIPTVTGVLAYDLIREWKSGFH